MSDMEKLFGELNKANQDTLILVAQGMQVAQEEKEKR